MYTSTKTDLLEIMQNLIFIRLEIGMLQFFSYDTINFQYIQITKFTYKTNNWNTNTNKIRRIKIYLKVLNFFANESANSTNWPLIAIAHNNKCIVSASALCAAMGGRLCSLLKISSSLYEMRFGDFEVGVKVASPFAVTTAVVADVLGDPKRHFAEFGFSPGALSITANE